MTRLNATNFSGALQFPYATAAADLFKKEDVQTMALAVDQHDHAAGKGLPVTRAGVLTFGTGSTPPVIQIRNSTGQPAGQYGLSIESSIESVYVGGRVNTSLMCNAYWDGATYQRWDVGQRSSLAQVVPGALAYYSVAASSGPISSWGTVAWMVDGDGNQYMNQSRSITWGGTNSQIMSYSRTMFFDEQSGWAWRATPGMATCLSLSNGGVLNAAAGMTAGYFLAAAGQTLGFQSAAVAQNDFINFGGNGSYSNATSSKIWWRRNYDNVTCMSLDGSGTLQVGNTLQISSGYLYLAAAGAVFTDGNHMYYRQAGTRDHYFQSEAAGWAPIYASAFNVQSTRKVKDNIAHLVDPLRLVLDDRLHGVSYTEKETGRARVGFVADDFAELLPEVIENDDQGEPGFFSYDQLGAVTWEALKQYVQQTNARIAALESRLQGAAA